MQQRYLAYNTTYCVTGHSDRSLFETQEFKLSIYNVKTVGWSRGCLSVRFPPRRGLRTISLPALTVSSSYLRSDHLPRSVKTLCSYLPHLFSTYSTSNLNARVFAKPPLHATDRFSLNRYFYIRPQCIVLFISPRSATASHFIRWIQYLISQCRRTTECGFSITLTDRRFERTKLRDELQIITTFGIVLVFCRRNLLSRTEAAFCNTIIFLYYIHS